IVWYLAQDPRLSSAATASLDLATEAGDPIFVPSICVVEMQYLIEKGRLPAEARRFLLQALDDPNQPARLLPLDRPILDAIEKVDRTDVPDMPDRIVAATALALGLPLVSRDARIRSSRVTTIW